MIAYEYKSFFLLLDNDAVPQEKLDALLNEVGAEGWRLHTSDPVLTVPFPAIFVVMDRAYETEDHVEVDAGPQAIEMKAGPS